MDNMLQAAKAAKSDIAQLTTQQKNSALFAMADALLSNREAILSANEADLRLAKDAISSVMLDRLRLTPDRIKGMADGIRQVAALPDPVDLLLDEYIRPDGLRIKKVSSPIGVVAIIYESALMSPAMLLHSH